MDGIINPISPFVNEILVWVRKINEYGTLHGTGKTFSRAGICGLKKQHGREK